MYTLNYLSCKQTQTHCILTISFSMARIFDIIMKSYNWKTIVKTMIKTKSVFKDALLFLATPNILTDDHSINQSYFIYT